MRPVRSWDLLRLADTAAVIDTARAAKHRIRQTVSDRSRSRPSCTVSANVAPPRAGPAVSAAAIALLTMLTVDRRVLAGVLCST